MSKDEFVAIRIDPATKQEIKSAARRKGMSISQFMIEASKKEIKKMVATATTETKSYSGVPTFFRACCLTAAEGGHGYNNAGFTLAGALGSLCPDSLSDDEWADEVSNLAQFVNRDDEESTIEWMEEHLPRCLKLIPRRRRSTFFAGIREFHDVHGITV